MPQQSRTFRLFVSSTFGDMKSERSLLQARVFPLLRQLCERHGARFQAVDLRWGVSEASQMDQQTMRICLSEITRCQRITPKPNFLILLGDRYGWLPLPEKILKTEFERLTPFWDEAEQALIGHWYRLDENALPAEYRLQPKTEEYRDPQRWAPLEASIRDGLQKAADSAALPEDARAKYFASATHQEILHGVLHPLPGLEEARKHVFAYAREMQNPPPADASTAYLEPDSQHRSQMNALKRELKQSLGGHYVPYAARWAEREIALADADGFVNRVYSDLSAIIARQLAELPPADTMGQELRLQDRFLQTHTEFFQGRAAALRALHTYVQTGNGGKIFALVGDAGSGKSSLMAQAIRLEQPRHRVFYRFIGISSASSAAYSLLTGLCAQMEADLGVPPPERTVSRQTRNDDPLVTLKDRLMRCLRQATAERPVLVYLDALDQLTHTEAAPSLDWLPWDLPEHARVIVSATTPLAAQLSDTALYPLPYLTFGESKAILTGWLKAADRQLTDAQWDSLFQACGSSLLAIHLRMIFEQVRHWHSYDVDQTVPADFPTAFGIYLDRLEKEHTPEIVARVLGFIVSGKESGMREDEILDLMAYDSVCWNQFLLRCHPEQVAEVKAMGKVPIVVWSRLYLDLEPYLTDRETAGEVVTGFFHRQFTQLARERYAADEQGMLLHRLLAEYFTQKPLYLGGEPDGKPNVRKVFEQPWQQLQGGLMSEAIGTLTDFAFCKAKCDCGLVMDLTEDDLLLERKSTPESNVHSNLRYAQTALTDVRALPRDALDFSNFFNRFCYRLDREPDLLLPLAYNYEADGKLHAEAKRRLGAGLMANQPWLLLLDLPIRSVRPLEKLLLTGHSDTVRGLAVSADEQLLYSCSDDDTVKIWKIETGACLKTIRCKQKGVNALAVSKKGDRIATGGNNGTVLVWDAAGNCLGELKGHEGKVLTVAMSKNGKRLASGGTDREIIVWDLLDQGRVQSFRLSGHSAKVVQVCFSPDERMLLSSDSNHRSFTVWNLIRQEKTDTPTLQRGAVNCITFSPQGQYVGVATGVPDGGCQKNTAGITVWDWKEYLKTGELREVFDHDMGLYRPFTRGGLAGITGNAALDLSLSPDGSLAVVCGFSDSVKVLDMNNDAALKNLRGYDKILKELRGHSDILCQAKLIAGRRMVASAGYDHTIRVWDLAGQEVTSYERVYRRVAVAGKGEKLSGQLGTSLLMENQHIRRWILNPLLALVIMFVIFGLSYVFGKFDDYLRQPILIPLLYLSLFLCAWRLDTDMGFTDTVVRGLLTFYRTRIAAKLLPPIAWLIKPFFKRYSCPQCGEPIAGRRGLWMCGRCDWSDHWRLDGQKVMIRISRRLSDAVLKRRIQGRRGFRLRKPRR